MPGKVTSEANIDSFWHENDERYVGRGERTSIDAMLWHRSLNDANGRRRGRPYVLPPAMLELVRRYIIELRLSLRAAEGHLRRMLSVLGIKAPDHTTIWKRLSKGEAGPVVPPRRAIVAIDSTGFSTTLRGEWMRDHWHKRRGFVKAHVAVDVMTLDVLAVVVTDDTIGDNAVFCELIEQVLDKDIVITRVLADGNYDTHDSFRFLRDQGIEAGIKIANDARTLSRGHTNARPFAVRERNSLGQEKWEVRYEYSLRWMVGCSFLRCETLAR